MTNVIKKDVFISYKDKGEGREFSIRLSKCLKEAGYQVYFNPDEKHSGHFDEEIREAVLNCKDLILVLDNGALKQLKAHREVDWIREELLTAHKSGKNIVPLVLPGAKYPKDKAEMPSDLAFIPTTQYVTIPKEYLEKSPFDALAGFLKSKPRQFDEFADTYNSNEQYDVVADFKSTLKEAEAGSESAMFEVAMMYYYGIADDDGDSVANYSKAYNWLNKLTNKENNYKHIALRMISSLYYGGLVPGEDQSYEKAYMYLEQTCNSTNAIHHLAFMTSIGSGCEFDVVKAEKMYRIATEKGDALSILGLARLLNKYGRFSEAAELFERIYAQIPEAAFELGRMYKTGVLSAPPCPDYRLAAFYYQYAIKDNAQNPEPYLELGLLHYNPTGGFKKDFKLAEHYFYNAAELGSSEAQYILGYMYWRGHVERSMEKAMKYLVMAADQGHVFAAIDLATLFQQPAVKNYEKASYYARRAAQAGSGHGAFIYANLLFLGRGCEANVDEAIKYYRFAVDHGYARAKFMLEKAERIARG